MVAGLLRVNDELDLGLTLSGLTTPEQDKVVVICTIAPERRDSEFRPSELANELPDDIVVVEVPHRLALPLRRRLGSDLSVSNGAARVYPVKVQGKDYRSMLYLPGKRPIAELRRLLITEATRAAMAASRGESSTFTPRRAASPGPTPKPSPYPKGSAGPQGPGNQASVSSGVTLLLDEAEVRRFAEHLLDPARAKPVVLISWAAARPAALVDSAQIARELVGIAEVYEIPTGAASWALADALSAYPGTEVYGGAGRAYPPGIGWTRDLHRSPLRFVWSPSESQQATEQLIADASSMAFAGGYRTQRSADARPASGVVKGIVSGRALVGLDGGGMATVVPELTVAELHAEHLFAPGMRVSGLLDPQLGRLDVSEAVRPNAELVGHYRPEDQILARVLVVEADLCVVELVPGLQVDLGVDEILDTPLSVDLRNWLTPGEVLTAVVKEVGASDDEWRLSVRDVDRTRTTLPAPALLEGGPAWLTAPDPATEVTPSAEPEVPEPVTVRHRPEHVAAESEESLTADRTEFEALRGERDSLAADLSRMRRALASKDDELRNRKAQARETSNEVAKLRRMLASSEEAVRAHDADRSAFSDPEQQLDYDVRLAWARRIPAAEKQALPLTDYTLGPEFLSTLQQVQGIDRSKVIEVLVDVLTGRVHQLHGRATHQLRTGTGGSDPFVARADGATCWRVSLQHKTPQARRLHYWQLNDGTIELSSIRLHDDFRP